ncbi:MAG: lipopolysaccharide heptosyltransferase II [Victivallales bacterium]|nr:lipopolysaccharide heptosyltransferase II [Victivallales bacterium]
MLARKVKPNLAAAPEFPVRHLNVKKLKDGIVVRVPNWLGDIVMTLPALMELKKMLPEYCGLFVICPPSAKDLFESLAMIDYVIPLEKVHRNWSKDDLQNVVKLRAGAGILFNNSLRDAVFMRLAGIKHLYGAQARGRSMLLKRSFPFPARRSRSLNNLHHSNKYLSIVKALGASDWNGDLPEFTIKYPLHQSIPEVIDVCSHPSLMTIAAGAAYGGSKRWSAENFREVANWWISEGGIVVALGTAKEKNIAEEVITGLPPEKAYNMAGKTDMCELMHLLLNSKICVANDSGIMHLSAVLGKPGIAIFGPTDHSATGPISNYWRVIYDKIVCSPCFKRECLYGHSQCMKLCSPRRVVEQIQEVLNTD